ncbi:hypothetical protein PS870_03012 [Pseudomonas fluorescens]|uniref:Uncharacterized protein n=1 Tax=Pseudomonas fluorescens TaxID=294 RepID=A0A5E7KUH2_PSEFL|nr:hypothetical protein PS870_03012 [Pseudomonas fluorescens]
MAAQGKHSSFTPKSMAFLAGIFVVAWVAITSLETYFDLTLLADTTSWLLRLGDWLLLETPMPNWSLLVIIAIFISTLSVAIYYVRIPDGTDGELHEIERKVYKKNNPQFPKLTDNQNATDGSFGLSCELQKSCKLELGLQTCLPQHGRS